MAQVGGTVTECTIDNRPFAPAGDAKVVIKLGGFSNEVAPNGNGTSRLLKTAEAGSVEGLSVAIDHDQADAQFLQDTQDGQKFVPFTITLADGNTYQGSVQITDMPGFDTSSATADLKLAADGKITRQ